MLPILSYLVPAFVGIITGAIVIESVFGLPGIGQLFVNGALNRDYGMILGLTIFGGYYDYFCSTPSSIFCMPLLTRKSVINPICAKAV